MLYNYLLVAWRNLVRQPFYSTINVLGLAVGIACFLLIMLFVQHETGFDTYHPNYDRIYRLQFNGKIGDSENEFPLAGPVTGPQMIEDFPEVIDAVRFRDYGRYLITVGEDHYKEDKLIHADPSIFRVFSLPLLAGDTATALEEPNTMIINERTAERYFKGEEAVGQSVKLENGEQYKVTGVFRNIPDNTHFDFDIIVSMASSKEAQQKVWLSLNFQTYLLLAEGADPAALEAKFPDMVAKYMGPEIKQYLNATMEEFLAGGNRLAFYLFPMQDIHLHSHLDNEFQANGDIKYVYIFTIIGVFILLIACINFMNLATARSAGRAKEVGLRKVMGAYRSNLVRQFLSESLLISLLALVIAIGLLWVSLDAFNALAGKSFRLEELFSPLTLGILAATSITAGLLAGSYPALYLSRFQPALVLKGVITRGRGSNILRSGLVVFQFTTTIILIVGTLVIYRQLNYIQNKNLGFNKERLVMLQDAYALDEKVEPYKEEMLQNPQILSATVASYSPVVNNSNGTAYFPGKTVAGKKTQLMNYWVVDDQFAETYALALKEGRFFSREIKTDTAAIVINETAAKMLFPGRENIAGEYVGGYGYNSPDEGHAVYQVAGVLSDFHFESLHEPIKPMVLHMGRSRRYITFKLDKQADVPAVIASLRETWEGMGTGQPFDFQFADQHYMTQYEAEQRVGRIAMVFSGLTIFIACLGLLGLAAFTAEQRTKEIGIRKVLGASVWQVMYLLSVSFGKLVLVAFVIGGVVAYFSMSEWLNAFEYRAPIAWWIFPLAGLGALGVAWLTMSYTSYRAATSNPASSLRSE